MSASFQQDIAAMHDYAAKAESLTTLLPELYTVFRRNGASLTGITHTYRICATDTGYTTAFALANGVFQECNAGDSVDVTVSGTEANLLAVFQQKLSPAKALLLKKIRVQGSIAALTKLAAFL